MSLASTRLLKSPRRIWAFGNDKFAKCLELDVFFAVFDCCEIQFLLSPRFLIETLTLLLLKFCDY